MAIVTLARRATPGRAGPKPTARPSKPRAKFAEIFTYGDGSVQPIPDLACAAHKIRRFRPGGADLILIGMSKIQGMKISQDSRGFVIVLIGLRQATLEMFSDDDEVVVAFEHGALRPAGVIGFLWDGESSPESRPPDSNSGLFNGLIKSRLHGIRELRRLKLG